MGSHPSLYVACDYFAGYRKADFCRSAYTKFANRIRPLQFGVGCFDLRADSISLFPFGRLLVGVHLIAQPDLGSDLQTKVTDRVARLAASIPMIRSSHRAFVQHLA